MGLLVHRHIDVAMTGHGSRVTCRQVPQLDVDEVRRREGSAADASPLSWDGYAERLRFAP